MGPSRPARQATPSHTRALADVARQRAAWLALCDGPLAGRRLIFAANRGPVEVPANGADNGDALGEVRRGQGGLVTALTALGASTEMVWVAATPAHSSRDEANVQRLAVDVDGRPMTFDLLSACPYRYHQYYDLFANGVLWFLQHGVDHAPTHPTFDAALWRAWEDGYVAVNARFAEHLARLALAEQGAAPVFMIQDYHLYLVPGMLRALRPDALIQHFTHIAWPQPERWHCLPDPVRRAVLESLLACDVVGFHTPRYAQNFLATCAEFLGVATDPTAMTVTWQGREVRVRAYPISIDPDGLAEAAMSPAVAKCEARILADRPPHLVVQVARTDPSKNILRSLHAYDHFLYTHPEFRRRVRFLGILPISRQGSPLYQTYLEEVMRVAERLERTYSEDGWQAIALHLDHDYDMAIAALKQYDVLMVNSISDGMNLVAKEGPLVNERAGALVLSDSVGALEEVGDAAIIVNPYDLVGMAAAIHHGLTMPAGMRARALSLQRQRIARNTVFRWAHEQLLDLLGLPRGPKPGSVTWWPGAKRVVAPETVEEGL